MPESLKKRFFLDGSIIAGSFLIFGLAVFFLKNDIGAEAAKISEARVRFAEQSQAAESLSQLKRDAEEAKKYERHMAALLPEKDQMLYFRDWIVSTGSSFGTEANYSLSTDQNSTPEAPGFITFTLAVRGEYQNVLSFLKYLENNQDRFLVELSDFDFRRVGQSYQVGSRGKAFHR